MINKTKGVLTCRLTSSELRQRKDGVIASLKPSVKSRKELKNGYEYSFQGSESLLDQLVEFVKSERACRPFFTFSLIVEDIESDILLKITGPRGAKDFLKTELDL